MSQDLSQPDDRKLVPSTASDSIEQPHPPSCRCWNCDIETTGLVKGLRAEIARLTTQAQYLAELHARMVRELVDSRDTLKRHLDAIAEVLHPHKPKDGGWTYLPDQLPEMVMAIKRENAALRQSVREYYFSKKLEEGGS